MSQFNAWSFLRDVLRRGEAIAESHRHSGVEDFNAKLDAVASKLADELKPHLAARPADDAEPVTEEWLESLGFAEAGINGYSKLLPPVNPKAAIAELYVSDEGIALRQGLPTGGNQVLADDLIAVTSLPDTITRGHVRRLLAALGIEEKR